MLAFDHENGLRITQSGTMNRILYSLFFIVLSSGILIGQTADPVLLTRTAPTGEARMCFNDAGTIASFGPFVGQSNDLGPDTIYLCLGDTLFIDHAGDEDLTSDPEPLTPAGVGYAFYNCEPTVTGPTVADVAGDACTLNDGNPPFGIYVYTGNNLGGDAPFFNDGNLQTTFNGGAPVHFWFAPITFDALNLGVLAEYEGDPAGDCVNASVDQHFSVVYLNEIVISEVNNNTGSSTGCTGTFRVQGGLPEFENFGVYPTVNIYRQDDPSIQGQVLNGAANHNDVVEFYVPEPGTYVIEIEDGKSCGAMTTVQMDACEDVTFILPLTNAMPGENICLDITVEDFIDVGSMQFIINFDPTIISWTGVQGFNPNMPDLDDGLFAESEPGILRFSWVDFSFNGVTLVDGSTIYQVCFDVIGQLGDCSPLEIIGDNTTPIEVGDASGTLDPFGVVIRQGKVNVTDAPFFVLLEQDSLSCPSFDDGSFTVTVDGAVEPYRFLWNTVPVGGPNNGPVIIPTDGGSSTVANLPAGTYQVTVTDTSVPPLEVVDTIMVLSGPVLGITIRDTIPTCFGEADGSLQFIPTLDGVPEPNPGPGYTFTWSVPNGVTNPGNTGYIDSIPAGSYGITVTDPAGCTSIALIPLGQPPILRIIDNNTFITDASCTGGADGEISVTASGGTTADGNYTFDWDTGFSVIGSTSTLTGINPGTYCVTVTDDNGCTFEECYSVGAVKMLSITSAVTDVSCNGLTDGEIFLTGNTTGAPADIPYTFAWSANAPAPNSTGTTSEITMLAAGQYSVTMTDASAAGCEVIDTFDVVQPELLVVNLLDQVNETCLVGSDGSIVTEVNGGTFPYTYTWSHDGALMDSVATGLSQGNYVLDVADANGCMDQLVVDILAPTPPTIVELNDDAVSCPDDEDGTLTVVAVPGGAAIDNYTWDNGLMGSSITNLAPGQYIVTVTATDACTAIDTALVTAPEPISLDSIDLRLPDCPGFTNGQITIFVSGGTAPYSYIWSTNPGVVTTQNPLPALGAGTYSVTIMDDSNCDPVVQEIILPDPPSIVGDFTNVMDTSCPDEFTCDGEATFTATYSDMTTGMFNFTWTSGEMTNNTDASSASQLCAGLQSVTVSDGVCGEIFDIEIGAPEPITGNVENTSPTCFGESDGVLSIDPSGGTGPYEFFWVHSAETTPEVSGLAAGSYTVIITDANDCTLENIIGLSEPDELILTIDPNVSTNFVSCNGDDDGVIAVSVNTAAMINPLGPAPFTWSGGVAPASANTATGLAAGSYGITVTDTEGCTDEVTFDIMEPEPITVVLDPIEPPLCFGDATFISVDTAFGGAGNDFMEFTFMVDNNGLSFPIIQPATVFAGEHIITVEDINGCSAETTVNIEQPGQIMINLPDEVVVELGDSTVQLSPLVTPGGTYTYQWDPADFLSSDTIRNPFVWPETSLEYSLTVTNENGCTEVEDVFVELDANRNVYIPNIFSPNGDGYNDFFRVFACRGVRSVNYARLFDRWGGIVYEGTNLDPSCLDGIKLWDGNKAGQPLNPGVYVYMIEVTFLDDVTLIYRGDVTVIR